MPHDSALFTEGSTLKHVVTMTAMSSVGLMAIFFVDFVDIYFLSLLGDVEVAASVGYAGSILFITMALCIGLSIGVGALTARAIGEGHEEDAKRYFVHCLIASLLISSIVSIIVFAGKDRALSLVGAKGFAKDLGHIYLDIMLCSVPITASAMLCMSTLRAYAEGGLSMMATIVGGVVNAVLDPILIFSFELNVAGAAWASLASRIAILISALVPLQYHYKVLKKPDWQLFYSDCKAFLSIASSAILTNLASPVGQAYITTQMAVYGDQAVAGMSVINRLTSLAFVVNFASSGAVGPIVGQNFGAKKWDRLKTIIFDSTTFLGIYCLAISLVLYMISSFLTEVFNLEGAGAELLIFFCSGICLFNFFDGIVFNINASFNNTDRATYATVINFSKVGLGFFPLVALGSYLWGVKGILVGQGLAMVGTALGALIWYQSYLKSLAINLEKNQLRLFNQN